MKRILVIVLGLVAIGGLGFFVADYFLAQDCAAADGAWDRRSFTCFGAHRTP